MGWFQNNDMMKTYSMKVIAALCMLRPETIATKCNHCTFMIFTLSASPDMSGFAK